eukprot:gene16256-biopygen8237
MELEYAFDAQSISPRGRISEQSNQRGPDAGRTLEFEQTDAGRTRAWPFLPVRVRVLFRPVQVSMKKTPGPAARRRCNGPRDGPYDGLMCNGQRHNFNGKLCKGQ